MIHLKCIKCETETEISGDKLAEIAEFVKKNGLKGDAYLRYINLSTGYTCLGDKEHVFEFNEEEDKYIHELAKQHNDAVKLYGESVKKAVDIKIQIEKLKLEEQAEIVKQVELLKAQIEYKDTLGYKTGNGDPEIWL